VFLKAGWVRRCKSINPGSLPTVVLRARRAIWTQVADYKIGDGQQRCQTCWAFVYGMWRHLVGSLCPDVSQNAASLSSRVGRSSRTPVTGKGTVFFWNVRRHSTGKSASLPTRTEFPCLPYSGVWKFQLLVIQHAVFVMRECVYWLNVLWSVCNNRNCRLFGVETYIEYFFMFIACILIN
jgi:hypothetical protein